MQLKKHISYLLSVLILVANMGLALNVHYCKGEVSAVSLAYGIKQACSHPENKHHTEKKCCAHTDKEHKSCCKNDFVKLKDKADNPVPVKSFQLELSGFVATQIWNSVQQYSEPVLLTTEEPAYYCEANAPPLFKLYCQYILYA